MDLPGARSFPARLDLTEALCHDYEHDSLMTALESYRADPPYQRSVPLSSRERDALMIALDTVQPLGKGSGRIAYQHPNAPDLILKFDATPVKGRTRWYERKPVIPPSNLREIEGYSSMICRIGRAQDFITRVHGWEATSRGSALLAENAHYGLTDAVTLNKLFKSPATAPFTMDEVAWARSRYSEIADLFRTCRVYNHGLKPESVMIGRRDGTLSMRLFDFKSIVYRQLISPRYLPRGEDTVQLITIRSVLAKFDRLLAKMDEQRP